MSKTVLITGASGFVGKHLISHLMNGDYRIVAGVFGSPLTDNPATESVTLDLTDAETVNHTIETVKPDWVFHLAALSSPAASFSDNNKTLVNNITAQSNLLTALVAHAPQARVLVVGSAEEYGKVDPGELPINEQCPLRPMSPYAISKITQDFMGLQYFFSYKLQVIRVRPFNHIGEGQNPQFAVPAFARQIALIEAGKQEPVLKVGNLEATRDFTDVKDMVRAYELAMTMGVAGDVYNLGSGRERVMQHVLDLLLQQAARPITVQPDPARMQVSDVPRLQADTAKFRELTGWQPVIPLEETLKRVLDYWREQVKTMT